MLNSRWLPYWLVFCVCLPTSALAASGEVRIISTNDIHGYMHPVHYRYLDQLRPWGIQSTEGDYVAKARYEGKVGGMAHVATTIHRLRSEVSGKALVLDGGDTWHGSGVSLFDRGVSMVKIMNTIGYDVMAPGNWEYIYPKEHLLELIGQAEFPVLAYNLVDKDWGDPVLEQYIIRQVGEIKIAIIGMTYPWTAITSTATGAAQWWDFGIREAEAEELVEQIQNDENPDLVVLISHAGYGMDQKLAQRIDGIDVIVSAHTHNPVFEPVVYNDTIVYEGGAHGEFVASLDLDIQDGKITGYRYQLVKVQQDHVPADPEVARLIDEAYQPHAERLNEVVGEAKGMFYRRDYWQSTMGNLVTDALRDIEGTDISFFPAWRYGATLMPGEITAEDIYNIVPTDRHIFTYTMPGKEIRNLLENILDGVVDQDPFSRVGGDMVRFSGLKIVYDASGKRGERVVSIRTADDQPFSMEKEYSVASAHTRFQHNPMFAAREIVDTGKVFVEALISHIRAHSPISPGLDNRIVARGSEGAAGVPASTTNQ